MTSTTALYSLVSAIVGGIIVAISNHYLASRREIAQKQRDLALSKLVDAWLLLQDACEKKISKPDLQKFEEAVRLVVLFGSDRQIDEIELAAKAITSGQIGDFTSVIVSLRRDIRQKLQIEGRDRHFWFSAAPMAKSDTP
jgi:hypothetical protein